MLIKSTVFTTLIGLALSKEMAQDQVKAATLYKTGVIHNRIMSNKHVRNLVVFDAEQANALQATWDRQRAAGAFNSSQYPELGYTECVNGKAVAISGDANNTFQCNNVDLYHFLSHEALGSNGGEGSSSWGWTSPGGREFLAIGQSDGAAFAEITKEGKLSYLGRLPQYSIPSIWREIRGYKNYMVIGSEAEGHYIQIFDMTKLLEIDPASPVTFSNDEDLTGLFKGLPIGRTHNVVINEQTNWGYAVGAQPRNSSCAAGLIFIDLSDPSNPTSPGCDSQDGYVHDAQCLIYNGPDKAYVGHEICYGYNEDTLTIYDVTNKPNSTVISRTSYQGAAYTHQGWVLDTNWQEYLLLDDEYDEYDQVEPAADGFHVTYIWDISSLASPKQTGLFKSSHHSVDHNQYVWGNFTYQSNYGSGLAVLDIGSIPSDPTGAGVSEVGWFDIYPEDDAEGGVIDFVGSWSSYAGFASGFVFVNTIERGGFVVKLKQ